MNKFQFQFDVPSFNKLFPFYILIDEKLNIKSSGEALLSYIPNETEVSFFSFFSIRNQESIDRQECIIPSILSQKISIYSIFDNTFCLNGKFETYQNYYLFIGTPCHSQIDKISSENKLNYSLGLNTFLFNSLVENVQTGVLLEDEHRNVCVINNKFCSMFHLEGNPENYIGQNVSVLMRQLKDFFTDKENFIRLVDETLLHQKSFLNKQLERIDGSYYEMSFNPIEAENRMNLWSFNDITLNKKHEIVLNAEKEKYRNIIDKMNIGLIEVDVNNVIVSVNQRVAEMSGYSIDYLIGKKFYEVFLDEDNQKLINEKRKTRQLGLSDAYEISIRNKDGAYKRWVVSGAPSYNLKGEFIGSIGLSFDITQTKDLESQRAELLRKLENQNQQLTEYAQIVSHDLKSPLRSIHSLITFIKEDNGREFNDKTAKYFVLIQEKVEKMDHLIQGILMYSKIGSQEVFKEEINLNNFLNYIISVIFIPSHIKISIKQELPTIKGDRFRIQQLFQNILSNAINYNDKPNGIVEVAFKEEHDCYVFSIYDNGMGISPKNQKKIFQMFQSFNTDNRTTGVGLSIVRKIIENLNEKIWLESEENVGTTFYFTIQK